MRRDEGEVEIEVEGKIYKADFKVEHGVVTVNSPMLGPKSTQVGDSPPESLARIMLGELVRDWNAREAKRR